MRVLLNAASSYMGGSVTYLRNLLAELAALGTGDSFVVVLPAPTRELLAPELAAAGVATEVYASPPGHNLRRLVFDQVEIPRLLRRTGAEVLFSAVGFGTAFRRVPEALYVRNALYFSRELEARMRALGHSTRVLRLRRLWTLASIRRAELVLVPSAAMAERLAGYTDLSRKRVEVLPFGFDRDRFFAPGGPSPVAERMASLRKAGRPVLLSVSTYFLHKDFETLVEAVLPLRSRGLDPVLVLTIDREHTNAPALFDRLVDRIRARGLEESVWLTGHRPYAELHRIYAEADLFVFPSRLESFGHPLLEAMASGTPVLAADTAVHREVLGEAGRYYEPGSAEALAEAAAALLGDPAARSSLAEAGRDRVRAFSWRGHSERLLVLLSELARGG